MCDCDCELPKQERWAQVREEVEPRLPGLEADSRKLAALEAAGVDNWEGYGHAMRVMHGEEDED